MEEAHVSARLTEFAADLTYEALPREVTEFVKLFVVDQIGLQLGLSPLPVSRIAHGYATSYGSGASTIVGSTARVPAEFAAFANGVAGHAFEMDDINLPSLNHPGPLVVPAALAMCEQERASGRTMIAAVAAGYEVMGRIGVGMGRDYVYGRGYHPVGVLGPFGSAMAAGKASGLPAEQMLHALGLATAHGAGTIEYNQTWGETTRLHAGLGAMGGVRCAALARAGLTGPGSPIAGKYGFARVHSDQCDFEMMIRDLGSSYILMHTVFKMRPYHGVLHAVIDKALEALSATEPLPRSNPSAAIRAIRVGLSGHMMRGLAEGDDPDAGRGSSSTWRQFSLRVPLANAILHGGTVDSVLGFDPADAEVSALAQKVSAEFDEACEQAWYLEKGHRGSRICVRVKIELADGRMLEGFGDPFDKQRTPRQLHDKFRSLAGRVLPSSRVDTLLDALQHLEAIGDVNELHPLLAP